MPRKIVLFLIAGLFFFGPANITATAEPTKENYEYFSGKVLSIDTSKNVISVESRFKKGGEILEFRGGDNTAYQQMSGIKDLFIGDYVGVKYKKEGSSNRLMEVLKLFSDK